MAGRFAIETVFKSVDKITKPFNKMQQRVRQGSQKMADSLKKLNAPLSKFTKGLAGVGKKGGLAIAGGIAAGSAALVVLNSKLRETVELAGAVGVSADLLENLGAAVAPAGFELDNIVDLIEEMNNKLGESAGLKELTPVTESLGILGIKFRDIRKLKPEEQFKKITDAALKMKDAQKAAAAVDILMGGEANKLIGILRKQGKTTDEILAAQRMYNARTDEGRKGAVAFSREIGKTNNMIGSLSSEIAGLVGGSMVPLLAKMTAYISANRDLIKTKVLEFFTQLKAKAEAAWQWLNEEGRLQSIIETIKGLGAAVVSVTGFLAEHGGKVAIVVGSLVALNAVMTTFIATMTAVNIVMALNPIGLIVIGVAALAAGVAGLIYYWDDVKGFMKDLAPDFVLEYVDKLTARISAMIKLTKMAFKMTGELFDKAADLNPVGDIKSFFGFGDESQEAEQAQRGQVVTPQERTARTIEESRTTNTAELLIRDETGRAEMRNTRPAPGISLNLAGSGSF